MTSNPNRTHISQPLTNSSDSTSRPTSGSAIGNHSSKTEKSGSGLDQGVLKAVPRAKGGVSVKKYDAQDIRDTWAAFQRPLSWPLEPDLLARACEIAELPQEDLNNLLEASKSDLGLSVLPLLPEGWQRMTFEVRALRERGLPHPSNMELTFLDSQNWFRPLLNQEPTWLTYVPINPDTEPVPILVQSFVAPCPGDHLILASIHQMACQFTEIMAKGGDPSQSINVEPELQTTVMWAVLRALPSDVEALCLGAISDRGYFRVLPGSKLALAATI